MASIQKKGTAYYCQFRYLGRRHTVTVGRVSEAEAEAFSGNVDYLLMRVKQKLLHIPPGVSVADFVLHNGQPPEPAARAPHEAVTPAGGPLTLRGLRDRYIAVRGDGSLEANSLATVRMHLTHFMKTLGPDFPVAALTLPDLQRHVSERARVKHRGKPLSPVTLRKEVAGLRAAWNWAALTGLVAGQFPGRGLVYRKGDEKPPFMTFEDVQKRAAGLPAEDAKELWESLYLKKSEIDELLAFVREHATQPWVYPLVCAAAHLGARRSELLAVRVEDVDFKADTVLIREKKRSRAQRTTRHVPLTPFLKGVLSEWLAAGHPGGQRLFAQEAVVARSKTRGATTGHAWGSNRPTSLRGRLSMVRARSGHAPSPVTRDEAHDHLKRTLSGSKWEVLRGYHVLRHSYISCLAAAGVDQRIIDDAVGHQTDEQRRRYRHLVPDVKQKAVAAVFG